MAEAVAVAVHLQDVDVVGETVPQRSGQPFDLDPFAERQVGSDQDGAPLVALVEDLEEQFRSGGGQGDEAQFVDDQQAEVEQFPLEVEQPSLIPGLQRSALPRFHRRYAPAWSPSRCTSPTWPWLETALFTAPAGNSRHLCSGGGWKPRFISPRQDGILLPIPARGAG